VSVNITFNTAQLLAGAEEAFKPANHLLGGEFTKSITENQWGWPTEPSPRDIVDKGQLRQSQRLEMLQPTLAEHSWNTEYAMAVHEGAVFDDGHSMPARPWVRTTIRDYDFAEAFARLAQLEMRKRSPP